MTIPFNQREKTFDTGPLNEFVQDKKILTCSVEFFQEGMNHYWCVFLHYEQVKEHKPQDVRPDLDEKQQKLLNKLKAWRKSKAEAEGVPVYVVATNSELEEVVIRRPGTLEGLRGIRGFGKAKVDRHGKEIIECMGGPDDRI